MQEIDAWLEEVVRALVGDAMHVRRARVAAWDGQSRQCVRCESRQNQCFSQKGYWPRSLVPEIGVLGICLPRVICECVGSMHLDFGGLPSPFQRLRAYGEINAHLTRS